MRGLATAIIAVIVFIFYFIAHAVGLGDAKYAGGAVQEVVQCRTIQPRAYAKSKRAPAGYRTETYIRELLNGFGAGAAPPVHFRPYGEYDPLPEELYEFVPEKTRAALAEYSNSISKYNALLADRGTNTSAVLDAPHQAAALMPLGHLTLDGLDAEAKLAYEYHGEYHYWPTAHELRRMQERPEAYLQSLRAEDERDARKRRTLERAGYKLILLHCGIPAAALCDYAASRLADTGINVTVARYLHPIHEPKSSKVDAVERFIAAGRTTPEAYAEFAADIKNERKSTRRRAAEQGTYAALFARR